MAEPSWRERFSAVFATPDQPERVRIMVEVYGGEFPVELNPYSYVSNTELVRFTQDLRIAAGDGLVDLGCGGAGPGLWVADRLGARLTGVDIADTAVAEARRRAAALGATADFRVGTFADTGLADGSADAVMSVDALLFAPDKAAACAEFARVLAPGGRLVLTTWDYHSQPVGRPPQVDDHRPLLAAAGLDVLTYEDTADWYARQVRSAELMLDRVDVLAAETGTAPADLRAGLLEMRATVECMSRRVLVVAQKP